MVGSLGTYLQALCLPAPGCAVHQNQRIGASQDRGYQRSHGLLIQATERLAVGAENAAERLAQAVRCGGDGWIGLGRL
jgi:hypothetical protein